MNTKYVLDQVAGMVDYVNGEVGDQVAGMVDYVNGELNMMTQTVQFMMDENNQLRQELKAMKTQLMGQTGAMK